MKTRYVYSRGHKSIDSAKESLWDSMAEGEVSWADDPQVITYKTTEGKTRYAITLADEY